MQLRHVYLALAVVLAAVLAIGTATGFAVYLGVAALVFWPARFVLEEHDRGPAQRARS